MEPLSFKLAAFEGPMELLCYLIEKNEIDIYHIPIAELSRQYIEYIADFPADMESMSSFLVMAANLLEIKSKMLLPRPKAEEAASDEDPRETLVRRLLEYKKFKEISDILRQKYESNYGLVFKEGELKSLRLLDNPDLNKILNGVTIDGLFSVFMDVLRRRELKQDTVRSSFNSVKKDLFTIDEKIDSIRKTLALKKVFYFEDIFHKNAVREEIIVTFLALLELIKQKEVAINQKGPFHKITISKFVGE